MSESQIEQDFWKGMNLRDFDAAARALMHWDRATLSELQARLKMIAVSVAKEEGIA
ncbi:MAG: hypothetical protein GY906_35615 [bacterium]|nr:hypothetical protein [bacterium]